ncbi:MAG: NAD-glutamate dehydrogenase, partial [Deltaproteobacteria bacterium]|nr:NAD-glutamate dehydrogenase [Deltaproteobacteria bacterium]
IERIQADLESLIQQVRETLDLVQVVSAERQFMQTRMQYLESLALNSDQADFVEWLQKGNFVSFGYARIEFSKTERSTSAKLLEGPHGWVPKNLYVNLSGKNTSNPLSGDLRKRLLRSNQFVVEYLDQISPLHRSEPLVYLGFRESLDEKTSCEHAFMGLFSQNSLNELTFNIPALRSKVQAALDRQHVLRDSYDYRKAVEIFNTFPKVSLFFLQDDELDRLVRSFVSLQRYQTVKIVVTRSLSLSDLTLLLIMPRNFYSRATVNRLETYLSRYFAAQRVDSRIIHFYSEYLSLHVRVVPSNDRVRIDVDRLEKMLTDRARPWNERLRKILNREYGGRVGGELWRKYHAGFPQEYRALIHHRYAVRDIRAFEKILQDEQEIFDLWGPFKERREFFRLQFYSLNESFLNELMPYLENLNLTVVDEVDFIIDVPDRKIYIKSFAIRNDQPNAKPLYPMRHALLNMIHGLRNGLIEDDFLNRLMVLTGLSWQEIDVFRAYRNYYFQLGNPFTKRRVAFALINNPKVAELLYRYFAARFRPNPDWNDPLDREEKAMMPVRLELAEALDQVNDINEDRILRSLFNLFDATVRTNFFLRRDQDEYFLSFKISAIGVIDMPLPRPMFETYVHSADMEGIHLRGGKVARGGIRWSDRPDDFRTEILGLMKTQMTKNSLIVPFGSKGGFVVKKPFETRDRGAELSKQAYKTLMRGLLDLVDNRISGELTHPDNLIVYDDFDPYLVVAADKGTAHLPDTANSVSSEYNFWLGDAFASGGSHGYDHKKLGITARGAWESVKTHFRERDKDIQSEDFTVIGIGDMSGDVFGNGMLLSKHIKLLAAFNHLHIFIDPNPDAATSWEERNRLFQLPRSTWADYNQELISPGGGVWLRSAKEIPLSTEIRAWLGVRYSSMDGEGLIRRILSAEAELLWNGGIGTYVKSTQEKHADVGDRTNDNVRINAAQLNVMVVGEGGNLGFTQKARIEFAQLGGQINTDAIDNSAGVDTSDHEVNLKIFFSGLQEKGVIKTAKTRNKLLLSVQEDICQRVLHNNYSQNLCLSLDLLRSKADIEPFIDVTDRLVNAGLLDRQGEYLPTRKELTARGVGFLRPELSILLSYSKMHIYQAMLESDLPDCESAERFLFGYFPGLICQRYKKYLENHPLRREIIATMITNRVVDQAGCSMFHNFERQTGASLSQGIAAYLVFDEIVQGDLFRKRIAEVNNQMASERQYELLLLLEATLSGLCQQVFEQKLPMAFDQDCIEDYRDRLQTFRIRLKDLLPKEEWQACSEDASVMIDEGFSEDHAQLLSASRFLPGFLPAVHIAETAGLDLFAVTEVMGALRQRLHLRMVIDSLDSFVAHDRWDRQAQVGLSSSFVRQFVSLSKSIITSGATVSNYLSERRQKVEIYLSMIETLRASPPNNISPYVVLLRALEALVD